MRPANLALLCMPLLAFGCGSGASDADLQVFAASSLSAAFTDIGDAFMADNPGVDVVIDVAGSSDLARQITDGAPADVFAAADLDTMQIVVDAGATTDRPVVFATNRAAIVVAPGNPKGIEGVDDLARDDLIVVQCAPEVPCGRYAQRIYDAVGVTVTPRSLEQNVKAVVTKVVLGEADAGIVYVTDVQAAADDTDGVPIPAEQNVVAEYPAVALGDDPDEAAVAFVDFLLGDVARAILARYGFGAP